MHLKHSTNCCGRWSAAYEYAIKQSTITSTKIKWNDIINGNKKGKHLKKYYNSLNTTIKSLSSETYFTFIKLPNLPPIVDNDEKMNRKLNIIYYQSLYVLLRGLPPTALVQTSEIKPVISTDL